MNAPKFKGLGFLLNSTDKVEVLCSSGQLYVQKSAIFGNGVFSKVAFKSGDTIEVVPIVEFDGKTNRIFDHVPAISNIRCSYPDGYDYPHANPNISGGGFIPLGYGAVYKGETGGVTGNAIIQFKIDSQSNPVGAAAITAVEDIPKDTEIIIKQNWDARVENTDLSDKNTILDDLRNQEIAITKSLLPALIAVKNASDKLNSTVLPALGEEAKAIIEAAGAGSTDISMVKLGEILQQLIAGLNELNAATSF